MFHEFSTSYLDLEVKNKVWQFCRRTEPKDEETILFSLRLLGTGIIEGSTFTNESRWGWEGDTLVFYAANKTVSTRFTELRTESGRMLWSGKFEFEPGIKHVLREWNIDAAWSSGSHYRTWLPYRLEQTLIAATEMP